LDGMTAMRAPRPIVLGGQRYLVAERTIGEWWQEVQSWILANVPGPIERVEQQYARMEAAGRPGLARARNRLLEVAAAQEWPPPPTSPAWYQAMSHPGAERMFLWFALRRDNPGLTEETVAELARTIAPQDMLRIILLAYGKVDPTEGGRDDPKAPAPPTGAGSSST
jgi:hypothetical protein